MNTLTQIATDLRNQNWMKALFLNSRGGVYMVGGIVRDSFLGLSSKDIDLVVEGATISEISSVLTHFGKLDIVGESFKVLKFKPTGFKGEPFDIATPRKDIKIGSGHKGFEAIDAETILEDLDRRDFTINSMAFNLKTNELIDPFNGAEDLTKKMLRSTNVVAFTEDPLRILRGIQFAARFGFSIEFNTLTMMRANAKDINQIAQERILEELQKIVKKNGNTKIAFTLLNKTGLAKEMFGQDLVGFENLEKLDNLSFYYVLAMSGGQLPDKFFRESLKGDNKTELSLKRLDTIIVTSQKHSDQLREIIFENIQKSPEIEFAVILPKSVTNIISMMNKGIIPKSNRDIRINGHDLQEMFVGISGEDIGICIKHIRQQALLGHFDWTSREKTLNFIEKDMGYQYF